ncbi:flagellar basal body-associated FliL family protein [Marinomonas sp. 15G1-11]|uniref:Flagellar protein FliL n=1 Tax=Marinomonas phaeophyticola TaxID=3004091 RepID=A0ABT4JY37_9GAMM|nr:flagellar basal body-associated FliL family protein [Marinomonas sp. 15G1-11]MCZ2723297.1 flagellar basal body-associated FliL family protein [Marinomonas sp. 15G1-11]
MAEDGLDVGEEEGKKGGKKKLIIIIIALLLVLGGGGGAAFFLLGGEDEAEVGTEESVDASAAGAGASATGPAIYLELDPAFVVDFIVANKQRYLQLNLTVKSRDQVKVDAIKVHMPLIRNSLVLLFANQNFDELQSLDGKMALKAAAIESINSILTQETGSGGVEDVLFTNFVMQ